MVKTTTCNAGDLGSLPGLERSPGGGHSNPLQYSCLENPHGQRSLAVYSPWGHKESDTTEELSTAHGLGPGLNPWCGCIHEAHVLTQQMKNTALISLQFPLPEVLSPFSFVFPTYAYPLKLDSEDTSIEKLMHYYFKLFNHFYILSSQRCLSINSLMFWFSILLI